MKEELLEFKEIGGDTLVTVNLVLPKKDADELRSIWLNRVEGCQPPFIEVVKYGMHLHIPWILKGEKKGE